MVSAFFNGDFQITVYAHPPELTASPMLRYFASKSHCQSKTSTSLFQRITSSCPFVSIVNSLRQTTAQPWMNWNAKSTKNSNARIAALQNTYLASTLSVIDPTNDLSSPRNNTYRMYFFSLTWKTAMQWSYHFKLVSDLLQPYMKNTKPPNTFPMLKLSDPSFMLQ